MARTQANQTKADHLNEGNGNHRSRLENNSIRAVSRLADLYFEASAQYREMAQGADEAAGESMLEKMELLAQQLFYIESKSIHDIAYKALIWHHLSSEDAKCPELATTDEFLAFQIMDEITKLAAKSGWDHKKY